MSSCSCVNVDLGNRSQLASCCLYVKVGLCATVCYRLVCEVTLDKLPLYDVTTNTLRSCHACARKGTNNQHVFAYCPQCDRIFCSPHHKVPTTFSFCTI